MRRIGRLTVGGLVGLGLIIGLSGVATASSATTTGNTATTNGTTAGGTSPATTVPITTSPTTITTSPSTTAPSTTGPSTTAPATKKNRSKKASKVMTGPEIWTVVFGHHKTIDCKRATKELKKIKRAVSAASVRLTRWQKMTATAQKSTATKAKAVAGRDGKSEKFFEKLSKRGNALIKRIDTKCGAKTTTS